METLVAPILVSTDELPPAERFDAWRETFALRLVRVDATVPDRANFRAAIGVLPLGQISIIGCDVGAIDLFRSRQLVQDGNDDISLVICMTGIANVRFDGDSLALRAGEATLVPNYRVGGITCDNDLSSLSLRIPRALLRNMFGGTEPPCLRPIPGHDGRLRLLSIYARTLMAEKSLRPATVKLADRQLVELVAHLLDPTADVARAALFGGVKAARLKAIIAEIDRYLARPELSAAWLGAKLGLSERYVHHLLAEADIGFAQLVRRKRLDLAYTMLKDRSGPSRRILDIAFAVGFNDLSNFNHAFRRQFGRTPSDVRRHG